MNPQVKLGLYLLTAIGSLVFGILFVQNWRRANAPVPAVVTPAPAQAQAASGQDATNVAGANPSTNEAAVASGTAVSELPPEREPVAQTALVLPGGRGWSRILFWGFLALAAVLGLGTLIAYDVSHYAGDRATEALFDDEGEELPESIDEQVEKAHGAGEFLEAVRLLRDYLKANPRAAQTQIRIAEIYEKDLNNPVAAALEYEEVLALPLPPDRRGWTAIHLVNLYNRLDKPDQAVALLQRIVQECPNTPAAIKARERLAAAGIEVPPPPASGDGGAAGESPSNLPPGFRPRGT